MKIGVDRWCSFKLIPLLSFFQYSFFLQNGNIFVRYGPVNFKSTVQIGIGRSHLSALELVPSGTGFPIGSIDS